MVLGEVEETVTTVELDEETMEEMIKVRARVSNAGLLFFWRVRGRHVRKARVHDALRPRNRLSFRASKNYEGECRCSCQACVKIATALSLSLHRS